MTWLLVAGLVVLFVARRRRRQLVAAVLPEAVPPGRRSPLSGRPDRGAL